MNRDAVEDEYMAKLDGLSARHRRELLDLLGKPPNPANVPPSFWSRVEQERRDEIAAMLLFIFTDHAINLGINDARAQSMGRQYASLRSEFVTRTYIPNLQTDLMGGLSASAEKSRSGLPTLTDAKEVVKKIFSPKKNEGLVGTEYTSASTAGAELAMKDQGLTSPNDVWKARPWRTKSGPCERCRKLDGKKRYQWESLVSGSGSGPPIHPYCACIIIYEFAGFLDSALMQS